MNGEPTMIALSDLVARGAFNAKSPQASERAARRWAKQLSTALRSKIGRAWWVAQDARLPGGQTVKAFLMCGASPERLEGFVVPPGALAWWNTKQRERFLNTHELRRRFDAYRAARPNMTEDACALLFADSPDGAWAREHGLSCDIRRIRSYRKRTNPESAKFDGNVDRRGRPRATQTELDELFHPDDQEEIRGFLFNQRCVSVAEAYRCVAPLAAQKGRSLPSVRTIQRWYHNLPEPEKVYHRQGPRRFEADCVPKIKQEYGDIPAGELWVGDQRTCDFWVRVEDARTGWRAIRPKLTSIQEAGSRMIIGWHFGPKANSDTILIALKMAANSYGLCVKWLIDNGRDYRLVGGDRRQWDEFDKTRLGTAAQQMGIEIGYTLPYWAWSKMIESWHRTMKGGFDRHQGAFCGGSPKERPENIVEFIGDVMSLPTLDKVRPRFAAYLESYHASPHTGDGMNGLTPALVMERRRGQIRKCDPAVLDLLCCKMVGPKTVHRDGVKHAGILYGQTNEEVFRLQGKRVWLRVHPDRVDSVTVCDDQGVPICEATCERLRGATQEDLRKAMEYKGRLRRKTREAQAGAVDLLYSKPDQVMELKRRTAKAAEDRLRKQLPAVAQAPAVTIVRPDLHEAAQKLAKQSGFDRLAAKAAVEGKRAVSLPQESVGAALARVFTDKAAPEPAKDVQAPDWAAYARQYKANAGREAALG